MEGLKEIFSQYGEVDHVLVSKKKSSAVIAFKSGSDAAKCVGVWEMDSRLIGWKVDWA